MREIQVSDYGRSGWAAYSLRSEADAVELTPSSKFVALRVTDTAAARSSACTLALLSELTLSMPALLAPEWLAALVRAMPALR